MAKEFKTGIFWDLIKTLFLVLLLYGFKNQNRKFLWLDKTFVFCSFLCFWFPKREVSITWQDVCSYFFVYSCKIHNRALNTKMALTKLLENILDESLKLENMSDERLGCLTKSLLSQNFYQTMFDLSNTLMLQPIIFCSKCS